MHNKVDKFIFMWNFTSSCHHVLDILCVQVLAHKPHIKILFWVFYSCFQNVLHQHIDEEALNQLKSHHIQGYGMMHIIIRSDTPWRMLFKLWNTSTSNSIVVSSECFLVRPILNIGCAFTSTNIKNCLMTFGPLTSNVLNVSWMSDYKYVRAKGIHVMPKLDFPIHATS